MVTFIGGLYMGENELGYTILDGVNKIIEILEGMIYAPEDSESEVEP